jgi:hypothetical protein
VCLIEAGASREKVRDRLRYTPERKAALVRANAKRQQSPAQRQARKEYHRQRYLTKKASA